MESFERAVEPQVEQLKLIARNMGEVVAQIKENNPSINSWELPQGEMVHSINNVLQTVMAVTLIGGLKSADENLIKQASRLEMLEDEMEASIRPSTIVRAIKTEIDNTIARHPEASLGW